MELTQENSTSVNKLQSKILVAAFVLLLVSVLWGAYSGYRVGQSKATLTQASNLNEALRFYYQDQDRYPSAEQFYNKNVLTAFNYISNLPKPENISGNCSSKTDFYYSQSSTQNFALSFCLTRSTGGFSKGTHTLTEKGTQ